MSSESQSKPDWWNLPNALTSLRIVGSPLLILLAYNGQFIWLFALAVVLIVTEVLDGFLARHWNQQSAMGARLDTIADAVFYSSILLAIVAADPGLIVHEIWWIGLAIGSYALSWMASWVKFRRLPSYHTWAAKAVWLIVVPGIICLIAGYSVWPFRVSMVGVVLANLEAILITRQLPECKVDVPTLWHASKSA